ncbi:MAG: hypothetical protein WCW93_03255, partial [Candidatus Paceibacterota bacterium]
FVRIYFFGGKKVVRIKNDTKIGVGVIHSFVEKVLYYVLKCEIIKGVRSNKYFWSVYCKLI